MGKRGFEELSVVAIGRQSVEERFSKQQRSRDASEVPPLSMWRCNLTGLSQVHNLYFIAYNEYIYCYAPQFPSQHLSQQAALILGSTPSQPGLTGVIDARCPHGINNLVVEFLGNEEVVATVRDDGDVEAFLVRHIVQAIEKRAEPGTAMGNFADDVRPFFKSNVRQSAWGLAIHSEARIIATSANTHCISIFKFGLIESDSRDVDVRQHVLNGTSNIPHIAFCNTGHDPAARWLLTTDISGFCRTIDLHNVQYAATYRFGAAGRSLFHESYDALNCGWGIFFLDPQSFIPEQSVAAAFGVQRDDNTLPKVSDNDLFWDIPGAAATVPDCSKVFNLSQRSSATTSQTDNATASVAAGMDLTSAATDSEAAWEDTDSMSDADQDDDMDADEAESPEDDYLLDFDDFTHGNARHAPLYAAYIANPENFRTGPSHVTDGRPSGDLPCPIMHVNRFSVFMLQPSNQRPAEQRYPFQPPTVGFYRVLEQQVEARFRSLEVHDRLNMHAYIPSIGVVVVASQKGRALVMSLTRFPRDSTSSHQSPLLTDEQRASRPTTGYGMRVEHILPFAQQEAAGQRPFKWLAGMAVGPMQGSERLPMRQKRWRLMMMYADHSILSYEIRRSSGQHAAVDLSALVG